MEFPPLLAELQQDRRDCLNQSAKERKPLHLHGVLKGLGFVCLPSGENEARLDTGDWSSSS